MPVARSLCSCRWHPIRQLFQAVRAPHNGSSAGEWQQCPWPDHCALAAGIQSGSSCFRLYGLCTMAPQLVNGSNAYGSTHCALATGIQTGSCFGLCGLRTMAPELVNDYNAYCTSQCAPAAGIQSGSSCFRLHPQQKSTLLASIHL